MKDENFVNKLLDMIIKDIEKSVIPYRKEVKPGYFELCHKRENKIDWSSPASYCLESEVLVRVNKNNGDVSICDFDEFERGKHNIFNYNIKLLADDMIVIINKREYGKNLINPHIVSEKLSKIYDIYELYAEQLEDKRNEILLKALQ